MTERLHVYQALWAMDKLVSPEASTAEKFDRVTHERKHNENADCSPTQALFAAHHQPVNDRGGQNNGGAGQKRQNSANQSNGKKNHH